MSLIKEFKLKMYDESFKGITLNWWVEIASYSSLTTIFLLFAEKAQLLAPEGGRECYGKCACADLPCSGPQLPKI